MFFSAEKQHNVPGQDFARNNGNQFSQLICIWFFCGSVRCFVSSVTNGRDHEKKIKRVLSASISHHRKSSCNDGDDVAGCTTHWDGLSHVFSFQI